MNEDKSNQSKYNQQITELMIKLIGQELNENEVNHLMKFFTNPKAILDNNNSNSYHELLNKMLEK